MTAPVAPKRTETKEGSFLEGKTKNPGTEATYYTPWDMFIFPTSSSLGERRVPPWGPEETRDLIVIRGEMEKEEKGKMKMGWEEEVSFRMRDKGWLRSPEQCKCKWNSLVHRYKGKETESGQLCPFFEELHLVSSEREESMHQLLVESEEGSTKSRKRDKQMVGKRSQREFSEGDYEIEHDFEEENVGRNNSRKRKGETSGMVKHSSKRKATDASDRNSAGGIHELLKEFLQQQQRMEIEWIKMMERHASEHKLFEQEWRESMEKLERERLMSDRAWREREEERRIRAEKRAERTDALLTTLLNQLLSEDSV